MKQKLQLQVPEPCHENWDMMNPLQEGRFCMSCQKEVIDFSVMTDKEILHYISTAGKKMCGRFGNDQLNRELVPSPEPRKIWWKHWMGIAASFIMLTSKSNAQVKIPGDSMVCTPPLSNNTSVLHGTVGMISVIGKADIIKNYIVHGVIKDEYDNPVPGATVMVKNTRTGVASNEKGMFDIKINGVKNTVLSISSVGYETQEIKITHNNSNPFITVNLKMHTTVMGKLGEVVIVKKKRKTILNLFKTDSVKSIPPPENVLKIYPNPAAMGADIKIKANDIANGNYTVSIYDINGNILINKAIVITSKRVEESITCDKRFNNGIYVMKLAGNDKIFASQFIIQ